jgi:hypothetical protein
MQGPSLKWRLAAAIGLTIGFYTLAILIAAALLCWRSRSCPGC